MAIVRTASLAGTGGIAVPSAANPTAIPVQAIALVDPETGNFVGVDVNGRPTVNTTGYNYFYRDTQLTKQAAAATAAAPVAGATIATVTPGALGMWEITVRYFLSGTVTAADVSNFQIRQNATPRLSPLLMPNTTGLVLTSVPLLLQCAAVDTVSVNVTAAASAAAVYNAEITARQVG